MSETVVLSARTAAALDMLPLITGRGSVLRSSKPKDGNAAYVWRMVAFSLSSNPKQHCMPMTADWDVKVPEDYLPEIPAEILTEQMRRLDTPDGRDFLRREGKDAETYVRGVWSTWRTSVGSRHQHYIKHVLGTIVSEIVDATPVTKQPGTMRWARAFGVV